MKGVNFRMPLTNTSAYVSDPTQWVDPMELTEWTGSSYQVSVLAGTGIKYDLRSQCLNNERGVASIVVGGGSYGRGHFRSGRK